MKFRAKSWYHIYNQGNNRQRIFFERDNYLFFLSKVRRLFQADFNIIAYCLMPNHFHFLVYIDFNEDREIEKSRSYSIKIGSLLSSYTKAINNRYNRTGSLFRSKTKAKSLTSEDQADENYILTCLHYIHQNPVRAKLVSQLEDWPYSSYRDYAGYRDGKLPDIKKGKEMLEFNSNEEFIKQSKGEINAYFLKQIW